MYREPSITKILEQFDKSGPVPRRIVEEWMQAEDIEVLGAVFAFITEKRCFDRITPPLSLHSCLSFVMKFCGRCIIEDPKGEWSCTRYLAGAELVNWLVYVWSNKNVPTHELHRVKEWLANLYKAGDKDVKICIVQSILEHLFEHEEIREFFRDWLSDPQLRPAYDEAREWSNRW